MSDVKAINATAEASTE